MAYCTITDLQHVLSSTGVSLRTDDGVTADEVAECIEEADWDINEALLGLFTAASIAASVWVQHQAKNIAVYLLSVRRGNLASASLAERYDSAKKKLEKLASGNYAMAHGIGLVWKRGAAPTLTNMRPTLRPFPRSVVEKTRSTGPSPTFNRNNLDPLDRTNQNLNVQV